MGKGAGKSSGTQQVVNSTEIPPYIADRLKTGLALGEDAIGSYDDKGKLVLNPYDQYEYTGDRIAGFSPDEQNTFDATRNSIGAYNPYINEAGDLARTGAQAYDADIKNQFTNSYSQNVVDEMARLSTKNLLENVLPGVNDTFIKGGSFGGTQNTDFTQRAISDAARRLTGQQADYLSQNENNANSQMANALDRSRQGGKQLSDLGQQLQSQQGIDLLRTGTIGQQIRNMDQRELDDTERRFTDKRDYQKNQADYLLGIARGTASTGGNETTQTTSKADANPYSQLAGIGTGAVALGKAKGGKVMRKKKAARKKLKRKE